MDNLKKIKDIFSDYKNNSQVQDCYICKIEINKKLNKLTIILKTEQFVQIKDMWDFEKYLTERFKIRDIEMIFTYNENTKIPEVKDEWKNIICYMAHKHPLMKPILLMKSTIEVENNNINVKMHIKGADFLKSRKTDKQVEITIKNLLGKEYKVNLEEQISKEELKRQEENNRLLEEKLIRDRIEEMKRYEEESKNKVQEPPEYYVPLPSDSDIPQEELGEIPPISEMPENNNLDYIIGKPSKAKENYVKIKDINANSGKVTIEGRIAELDSRDTKSGKKIIIMDVYDGTGIMTCKSFSTMEEADGILEKLNKIKAVKIIGKAGLDTYAGDVNIIANSVIETDAEVPELPEEDNSSPLIMGTTMTINEPLVQIKNLGVDDKKVSLQGEVINTEDRELKSGRVLYSFDLYDGTSTLTCKAFLDKKNAKKIMGRVKNAKAIKIAGTAQMDSFSHELTVMAYTILEIEPLKKEVRMDNAEEKRVELHMHTKMSQMDGMTSAKDLIKRAMKWGMKSIAITDHGVVQAEEKRVELHMHTKMSQMDGMTSAKDLIKRAMKWGMKSIAITDHGVVQAFPEAHKLLGFDNHDIKIIYGVEAYLAPDKVSPVSFSKGQSIDTTYCVLDLETTGFSFRTEKITEVGIMKVKNGEVIDEFSCFVNPEKPIPQRVVEVTNITDDMVKDAETIDKVMPKILEFVGDSEFSCFVNPEKPIPQRVVEVTNITDDMVKDAETIDKVMPKILEFVGDSVLVAHNADFDIGFLKYNAKKLGLSLENTYLDTLRLAKDLFPDYKKYKLGKIAENLGIKVEVAHRALDDVDTTVKVLNVMLKMLKDKGVETLDDITKKVAGDADFKKLPTYHAIILATNYVGLKNLYKLVSISHLDYFYKKPRILKSMYKKYSEGLILGSACEAGELYQAIEMGKLVSISHLDYFYKKPRILKSMYKKYSEGLILGSACEAGELYQAIEMGKSDEEIEDIAKDYDYLEIQPLGNNEFLVRNGTVPDKEGLININKKIVEVGERLNKLVVATCDVHFMDPSDEIYRRMLQAGQGYDDADEQAPLYLRTTEEMLKEFDYLGEEKAYEVVVTNTNKVSDMCDRISPISPEKCPPHIPGCETTIKEIAYSKAHELYGDPLPDIVEERLDKELTSIIKNGFSVMYIIAQKLVWKSNEDGYIVGSRGISPISPEKCPPHIPGCETTIKEIAYSKAHELYGDPLPDIVEERLDKELTSIIKNGFSVMYIIAQKLVWKSNEDGYIVGSRGSVGSSFAANMTGITEVNSLPAHYRCPNCKYSDFTDYGYKNGFDLPDKDCPKCGTKLLKDGMDIPFETFLGFNGDKEPDIDLNRTRYRLKLFW